MTDQLTQETDESHLLPEGEPLVLNEWEQGMAFLFAGIALIVGFLALLSSLRGPLHGPALPVAGLVWIGVGALFLQSGRAGLIVEKDGITLRGIIRRRHWSWREIKDFEIKFVIFFPPLKITLNDGGHVRVPGFRGRTGKDRELAKKRVAELNRRVSTAQTVGST
ncbi:MAG: PH domain-containing protein [Actinobacteria bacterium]|nr:PH domain-containing protein [Actinomycetota bacterium]